MRKRAPVLLMLLIGALSACAQEAPIEDVLPPVFSTIEAARPGLDLVEEATVNLVVSFESNNRIQTIGATGVVVGQAPGGELLVASAYHAFGDLETEELLKLEDLEVQGVKTGVIYLSWDVERDVIIVLLLDLKDRPIVPLATSPLTPDKTVFVVGYPQIPALIGRHLAVTAFQITKVNDETLQLIGGTYPGSSGSPVANDKGELVGLVIESNVYQTWSTPVHHVARLLKEALEKISK